MDKRLINTPPVSAGCPRVDGSSRTTRNKRNKSRGGVNDRQWVSRARVLPADLRPRGGRGVDRCWRSRGLSGGAGAAALIFSKAPRPRRTETKAGGAGGWGGQRGVAGLEMGG